MVIAILAILSAIISIILILLLLKLEFLISLEMVNKKTSVKWKLKLFGDLYNLPQKKKKTVDKKAQRDAEKTKKETEHISVRELFEMRSEILDIASALIDYFENNIKISRFDTEITLALKDPFTNGIAYGAVSGAANIIYGLIIGNFKIKNYHLDINSDFNSKTGVLLNFEGAFFARPLIAAVSLAKTLILNQELRNNINKIKKLFHKEEEINE